MRLGFDVAELAAVPGGTVVFPFSVVNESTDIESYDYHLEIDDERFRREWVEVYAPSTLAPATLGSGRCEIELPEQGAPPAGAYQLRLVGVNRKSRLAVPAEFVVVVDHKRADLCVRFPESPSFFLNPDGTVDVTLHLVNCGSFDLKVRLHFRHQDGWEFEVDSPELTVEAADSAIKFRLSLRAPAGRSVEAGAEITAEVEVDGHVLDRRSGRAAAKPPGFRHRYMLVGASLLGLIVLALIARELMDLGDRDGPVAVQAVPALVSFGDGEVRALSGARAVTVRNTGRTDADLEEVEINGLNRDDFLLLSDKCDGVRLPPGGNCTIRVAFRPEELGPRSASLTIHHGPSGSPAAVALSGIGTPTGSPTESPTEIKGGDGVRLDPAYIDFDRQDVGAAATPQTVTLTNGSDSVMGLEKTAVVGPNREDFSLKLDKCSGTTLSPGGSCTIEVIFKPTMLGPRSASLTITHSHSDSVSAVALSGIGVDKTSPSAPTGVTVEKANCEEVLISWDPSTDNVAVDGYTVHREPVHHTGTAASKDVTDGSTSYSEDPDSRWYTYTIVAFDAEGNRSAPSEGVQAGCPPVD